MHIKMRNKKYHYYKVIFNYYINKFYARKYADHPFRIIWVKPSEIIYARKREEKIVDNNNYTYTLNGNWDIYCPLFKNISLAYKLYENEYIISNDSYDIVLSNINKYGKYYHNCKNKCDLNKRLDKNKKLYDRIKKYGYLTPPGIKYGEPGIANNYVKEVKIALSRSGEYIFVSGHHRLSIAKILNIEKIPVQITVRHSIWNDFRKKIINEKKYTRKLEIAGKYNRHPDIEYLL